MAAAAVARMPAVRAVLVARQRALGGGGGVVMEGRDIGTVVFPGAEVKVYLDASAEERARRRAADPAHTGGATSDVAHVAEGMAARDKSDSTRTVAPLRWPPTPSTSTPPACRSSGGRAGDGAGARQTAASG